MRVILVIDLGPPDPEDRNAQILERAAKVGVFAAIAHEPVVEPARGNPAGAVDGEVERPETPVVLAAGTASGRWPLPVRMPHRQPFEQIVIQPPCRGPPGQIPYLAHQQAGLLTGVRQVIGHQIRMRNAVDIDEHQQIAAGGPRHSVAGGGQGQLGSGDEDLSHREIRGGQIVIGRVLHHPDDQFVGRHRLRLEPGDDVSQMFGPTGGDRQCGDTAHA